MPTSALERIRRLVLGRNPDHRANVSSALTTVGRLELGGLDPVPGPFDSPPKDTVTLTSELPWELQDDDALPDSSTSHRAPRPGPEG